MDDQALDEEYVMTWMGLILADTTLFDDETLVRAFKQLIEHLEGHIDTFSTPARPRSIGVLTCEGVWRARRDSNPQPSDP